MDGQYLSLAQCTPRMTLAVYSWVDREKEKRGGCMHSFVSEMCWGKAMVVYTKASKKEERGRCKANRRER